MDALPPIPQPAVKRASSNAAGASRDIRRLSEEDLGLAIEGLRDGLELGGRLREVDQLDVGAAQGGHLAPLALVCRVDRVQAEPGGQHTVEGRGGAAALDVTEDRRACLVAGPLLDLPLEPLRDPTEANVTERVLRRLLR